MNRTDTELQAILNRLADGIGSEADEQRLHEMLRSSVEARKAYREFVTLHASLHWDYVAAAAPQTPPLSLPAASTVLRAGWLVAFAAGVVVASVVAVIVLRPIGPATTDTSAPAASNAGLTNEGRKNDGLTGDPIAALLVDEVGAEFGRDQSPAGVRFGPGRYDLLKGTVHLRFAQGADVVLAGPARLHVTDAQHIRLAYGKIRVTAPPSAQGFEVATPAADFVDLGTEFGLRVDPQSGASDLYVFDGQVNVADAQTGKVLSEVVEGQSSLAQSSRRLNCGGKIFPRPAESA